MDEEKDFDLFTELGRRVGYWERQEPCPRSGDPLLLLVLCNRQFVTTNFSACVENLASTTGGHPLSEATGTNALATTDAEFDLHGKSWVRNFERRHPDSNRGMMVLQTIALAPWLCRRGRRRLMDPSYRQRMGLFFKSAQASKETHAQ